MHFEQRLQGPIKHVTATGTPMRHTGLTAAQATTMAGTFVNARTGPQAKPHSRSKSTSSNTTRERMSVFSAVKSAFVSAIT